MVIAGHSFIRRLQDFTEKWSSKAHLRLQQSCDISWVGRGGARVNFLFENLNYLISHDVIVIQIGGNDLCNDRPVVVFNKIRDFISKLREEMPAGAMIVVCGLMYRSKIRAATREGRDPRTYNWKVTTVNDILYHYYLDDCQVNVWYHHNETLLEHLDGDGVHLQEFTERDRSGRPETSPAGQDLYWSSIRGAVLSGLRRFTY